MEAPTEFLRSSLARAAVEIVALDHDSVRRRLPLDPLEPRHRPARDLGEPERERRRLALLGDAVLGDVAVEVGQPEGGLIRHA
jgi:hypothetical protein